jgi:hypothetical protein
MRSMSERKISAASLRLSSPVQHLSKVCHKLARHRAGRCVPYHATVSSIT